MPQVERLVTEAMVSFDPSRLRLQIELAGDRRRSDVDLDATDLARLVPVGGMIDLPDALALDAALDHAAAELAALGSTGTAQSRRARAVGDLAREHLDLYRQLQPDGRVVVDTEARTVTPVAPAVLGAPDGECLQDGPGTPSSPAPSEQSRLGASRRDVVLHLHITDRELQDALRGKALLGRVENTAAPISVDVIRRWCGGGHTRITVQPVIDLAAHLHHDAYEIPHRMREQAIAWGSHLRLPLVSHPGALLRHRPHRPLRPRRPGRSRPEAAGGGQTETSNLAPLCRHHHNLKTSGAVRYETTAPGTYRWSFRHGRAYVRDATGTRPAPPDT